MLVASAGNYALHRSYTRLCFLCRDAQRFTMKLSPEDATRLRIATGSLTAGSLTAYNNARRLQQQQAASVTAGLPVLSGLPNPLDMPVLPTSTSGGMLGGLSRGLSLPRAGLPGMGSPVVSSPSLPGLGGMLPPGGPSNMSRRITSMLNMARVSFTSFVFVLSQSVDCCSSI